MSNIKFNKQIETIIRSPIVAYKKMYELHDFDELHELVKSVCSGKDEISDLEILISMEKYALVYELFRPSKIERSDYYWGSVRIMDKIYNTLYSYLGMQKLRYFSNAFYYQEYGEVKRISFEKVAWEYLLQDIKWVIGCIKKNIGREALKLYLNIDNDYYLGLKSLIRDYIRLMRKNDKLEIKFIEKPIRKIIIEGREIVVDNVQARYMLEHDLFYDIY